MSSKGGFQALYVAPIVVALATAVIGVFVPKLFSSGTSTPETPTPANTGGVAKPPESAGPSPTPAAARPPVEYPKDEGTKKIVVAYLDDHAKADQQYRGRSVELCSVVASVEAGGVVELYGAVLESKVEGLYFKCHFDTPPPATEVERNALVRVRGTVTGYTHHPKSPSVLITSCELVAPKGK